MDVIYPLFKHIRITIMIISNVIKDRADEQEAYHKIFENVEKKYLSAVIKPFRSRVKYIRKCISHDEFEQRIKIVFYNGYFTYLPYFKANTMYKGMETDKDYTLKGLVL